MTGPSPLPRPVAAVGLAHAGADEVERATAALVSPQVGSLNEAVLALLAAHSEGLTATELLDAYLAENDTRTGLYSLAPRLSQLERLGWCEKNGHRTRPGERRRTVYRLTSDAATQLLRGRLAASA